MAEYGEIIREPRMSNITNQEIRIEWVADRLSENVYARTQTPVWARTCIRSSASIHICY
jgi:hypothetical protein